MQSRWFLLLVLLGTLLVAVVACGGGDDSHGKSVTEPTTTPSRTVRNTPRATKTPTETESYWARVQEMGGDLVEIVSEKWWAAALTEPMFGSEWSRAVEGMASTVNSMRVRLESLTPPLECRKIHDKLVWSVLNLSSAMHNTSDMASNLNPFLEDPLDAFEDTQAAIVAEGVPILDAVLVITAEHCGGPGASTATFTPGGAKIDVVSHTEFKTMDGRWFVGEVVNTGDEAASSIEVSITLFDATGTNLGTFVGRVYGPRVLWPGDRAPIRIAASDAPTTWASEKVETQFKEVTSFDMKWDYSSFDVTGGEVKAIDADSFTSSGRVTNTGSHKVENVWVYFVGRDASGNVSVVDSTWVTWDTAGPGGEDEAGGESGSFGFVFSNAGVPPASYEYIVRGTAVWQTSY